MMEEYNYYRRGCNQPNNCQKEDIPNISKPYEWCIYMLCKIRDQAIIDHEEWKTQKMFNTTTWKRTEENIKDHFTDPLIIYNNSWAKEMLDSIGEVVKEENIAHYYEPARPQVNMRELIALDLDEKNQTYFHSIGWPYLNYRRKNGKKST